MCLAAPGLSCGAEDLWSSLGHTGSLVAACGLLVRAWGLAPWPGIEPRPPAVGVWSQPLNFKELPLCWHLSLYNSCCGADCALLGFKQYPCPFTYWISVVLTCMHAKSLQSCLFLCDPMDCSLPGSSVMEFSRQEYWSGVPCTLPGGLPDPGIEPVSLALQAGSLPLSHWGSPAPTDQDV